MMKKQGYTIISNQLINDVNLRYEDIGLLVYVLSKTDCSVVNIKTLVSGHQNKYEDVIDILRNLEANGYLQIVPEEQGDLYSCEDYIFINCTEEGK